MRRRTDVAETPGGNWCITAPIPNHARSGNTDSQSVEAKYKAIRVKSPVATARREKNVAARPAQRLTARNAAVRFASARAIAPSGDTDPAGSASVSVGRNVSMPSIVTHLSTHGARAVSTVQTTSQIATPPATTGAAARIGIQTARAREPILARTCASPIGGSVAMTARRNPGIT